MWNEPLTFSFTNITLLDLTMDDAVLWLVMILEAIPSSTSLQRLIIRFCKSWDESALPFPFADLDRLLSTFPDAKLLIAWGWGGGEDSFIEDFRRQLPILASRGFIGVLYSSGPYCESCRACISCPSTHFVDQLFYHLTRNIWVQSGSAQFRMKNITIHMSGAALMNGRGCILANKTLSGMLLLDGILVVLLLDYIVLQFSGSFYVP